jgi:predicted DNA-binding transcriptional regulator AlpA
MQSWKVTRQRLGNVSDMTIRRRIHDGTLPAPIKIGRRNYWRKSDIDACISNGLRSGTYTAPKAAV